MVSGLQEQKQNMIDDMSKHFKEIELKTGEMKTLIGQSETVLQDKGASLTVHLNP